MYQCVPEVWAAPGAKWGEKMGTKLTKIEIIQNLAANRVVQEASVPKFLGILDNFLMQF